MGRRQRSHLKVKVPNIFRLFSLCPVLVFGVDVRGGDAVDVGDVGDAVGAVRGRVESSFVACVTVQAQS